MRNRFGEAWQAVATDRRFFVPFLVATVALGVFTGALTDWLAKWLEPAPWGLPAIAGSAFVVFAVALYVVMRRLEPRSLPLDLTIAGPEKRRGLIYMVSHEAPARQAVAYHRPTLVRCWLLCSQKTAEMAKTLQAEFDSRYAGGPELVTTIWVINKIDDPEETYQAVCQIHREAGKAELESSQVIADYLGMNVHCSVGMALACLDNNWPIECTRSVQDSQGNWQPQDPVEIRFDFAAHGGQSPEERLLAEPPDEASVAAG